MGTDGEKLSKQNGASAIDTSTAEAASEALCAAAKTLGLPVCATNTRHAAIQDAMPQWIAAWRTQFPV